MCHVTGSRRYSEDLIQGRLEKISWMLIFEGGATLTTKAKKLVVSAPLGARIRRVFQGLNDLAGFTEDERCPVGEGRRSSDDLK